MRLLAEAFGPKVWERAVVVFTFAGSPLPAGQDFAGHLENRLRVLQWEIAQHADGATARAIPGVAVENRPPRKLPDGSEWLGELWVRVLERLSPMAGLSYFLATAERVREGQIPLSPEQQARTKRVIDAKIILGLAAVGAAVGSAFGPVGTVVGGAVGAAAGLLAWLWR